MNCPHCHSARTYFLMPAGLNLKCAECYAVWPFRFIFFVREVAA